MTSPSYTFSWSYSALSSYETCPRRHYHYNVVKDIKEPQSPALIEGRNLHTAFENRIKEGTELPAAYARHEKLLDTITKSPGETQTEQKLALTNEFKPSAFFAKSVWFRTIIDLAKINGKSAVILDYKTGKPKPDPLQLDLMSATLFHHLPNLETVRAALLFVNYDRTETYSYTREDLPRIWNGVLPRVRKLEKARRDEDFPPNPSGLCRNYCAVKSCPYHGVGG